MATRFYLPSTGAAAVAPDYDGAWEDTASASRLAAVTEKISSAMANAAISGDSDATDKDYLTRQYVSVPIAAQTISVQTIKFQVRAQEDSSNNNLFTTIGIRVVTNDGSSVRGTVLAVTSDNTEMVVNSTPENRQFSATSTQVIAEANDRIVIEVGVGGDPSPAGNHDGYLVIGDNSGTDLPENDTETSAYNPWVEFANTLTWPGTTVDDTRPARTEGYDTAADNRPARTEGFDTANDTRPARTEGKVITTDTRPARAEGFDTANDNRPARAEGLDVVSDNRPSRTEGFDTVSDNRPARAEGYDTCLLYTSPSPRDRS